MEKTNEKQEKVFEKNRPSLFCSFVKNNMYMIAKAIKEIKGNVKGGSGFIFVLENEEDPDKIFLVYNTSDSTEIKVKNTIRVSRFKETNTIYTISALNELTKKEKNQDDKTKSIYPMPDSNW